MTRVLLMVLAGAVLGAGAHAQKTEYKNPTDLAKPNGYSHVVVVPAGRLVFISGQTGLNSKGEMAAGFAAQAAQAFASLRSALASAGATPADVVKLNYYVVGLDREKLLALRVERDKFVDAQHLPASTLAGVQTLFREDALVEIEAEAVLPARK